LREKIAYFSSISTPANGNTEVQTDSTLNPDSCEEQGTQQKTKIKYMYCLCNYSYTVLSENMTVNNRLPPDLYSGKQKIGYQAVPKYTVHTIFF